MRILLVEDDRQLADGITRALRQSGTAVDWLVDGAEADEVLATEPYDLAVLDLTLPGLDGLEVLRRLRARGGRTPVLVLTARGELQQRVTGLDAGADDYLTKPFDLEELEARARALLRRGQGGTPPHIVHGRLTLDTVGRRATVDGQELTLPRRELNVLEVLLNNAGRVVSKEQIADHIFGFDDEAGPNAIELYIHRLRKRLDTAAAIRTVRGLGYMLEAPR